MSIRAISSASQTRRSGFQGLFLCCVESPEQPLNVVNAPPESNTIKEVDVPNENPVESGDSDDDAMETFHFLKDKRNASIMESGVLSPSKLSISAEKVSLTASRYISMNACLFYHAAENYFSVNIHQVLWPTENPTEVGTLADPTQQHYLRGELLPERKMGFETQPQSGPNAMFQETFTFDIQSIDIVKMHTILIRLIRCEKDLSETLVAHQVIILADENLESEEMKQYILEWPSPTDQYDDLKRPLSDSSKQSTLQTGLAPVKPQLQICLQHNEVTGRLSVELLRSLGLFVNDKPPDVYVKLVLLSSAGKELSHSKTNVKKGLSDPTFNERFLFSVPSFQLSDVTLLFTVYHKKTMNRKDSIGWFALGLNSSGQNEFIHWHELRTSRGQAITRWHPLHKRS